MPQWGTTGDYNNFAPRIGFAYDVFGDGKTSVRGGAGLFYNTRSVGITNNGFVDAQPFTYSINITQPQGTFSNPYAGLSPVPFSAASNAPAAGTVPGRNTSFVAPEQVVTWDPGNKFVVPMTYNWNLSVEHEFAWNWLLRASYVGSTSNHLQETMDLNPTRYLPGTGLTGDKTRALPPYGAIAQDSQSANDFFDSLQLTAEKRFTKNVTILANYSYGKNISTTPAGQGQVDFGKGGLPVTMPSFNSFDRGPIDFDVAQHFVTSYVWQLPQLANYSRPVRGFLGGWEWSGAVTAQTGFPFTITSGANQSGSGEGYDRPNQVSSVVRSSTACGTSAPCVSYLNRSAFQTSPAGTFGTLGKGTVRGPGLFDWDMGVFKNFPLKGDRYSLQFRAEFFNVFNRANFNNPTASLSSGGFGTITSAADPRIGQFALKLFF